MENLSTTQKLLLIVLATYANAQGECWPRVDRRNFPASLSQNGT
ncbi:helix-turn-helix domain-containing protein [Endozoicomonas sp. YOMI1]